MKSKLSGKLFDIPTHRQVAKAGMTASLAVLTITAFNMKNRAFKRAHIVAGVAMVAFSVYHAGLYDNGIFKKFLQKQAQKARLKSDN
ncbi:helicase [Campylobacter gastrosuis]|uniref:Helicase n=1 Tax=Campylobacter gastrosuis TaxID=2974576 RepID=A0ABT7HMP5_9BACT|nr:helicase [Campylobacter gastrosuis]MDL0088191.1 helicase [Campylobacter gastrosuis]